MTRLFTDEILPENQETYTFTGDDAHYLSDVLRMQTGESLILCDGARTDFTGLISALSHDSVTVSLIHRELNQTEPPYQAILYQGIVKGDKMDWIIQKGVELGVSAVVPVICSRSISKLEGKDIAKKLARWQKIAEEASRQCGRGHIPQVMPPISFAKAIQQSVEKSDLVFLPWEGEKSCPLSTVLERFLEHQPQSGGTRPKISFFIGPEGGFDPKEIDLSLQTGVSTVTLGRRILRTETAGLAVLSMLIYRLERM